MQITDKYTGEKEYITYYDNYERKKGKSYIDEDNLKDIANDLGIDYIYSDDYKELDKKLSEINKITKSQLTDTNKSSYTDLYYIFIIPIFILLVIKYKKIKEELTI